MAHVQTSDSNSMAGAVWALFAVICFSVNDIIIKYLSGDYPLHQVVLLRSLFGMTLVLALIVPLSGGLSSIRTRRMGLHILRGLCVFTANMFFFLGLASMPLAETVAIFFVGPVLIAVASVVFLGETVGLRRWLAIAAGMVGVLIVLRPGAEAFQPAALLPLIAAFAYAGLHTLTRKMGVTEGGASLIFYIQITMIFGSAAFGLLLGHGNFAGSGGPSLEFLLRAWVWPAPFDLALIAITGGSIALGGYAIGQAYRISEAALVAPFEYAALPIAIVTGWVVFSEWPDTSTFAGIGLILTSGLVLIWREAVARKAVSSRPPAHR